MVLHMQMTNPQPNEGLLFKLATIAFLVIITWIPTFLVGSLTGEREGRADEAHAEIGTKWSREQTLNGPVITIPRKSTAVVDGKQVVTDGYIFLLPEELTYDATLDTQVLSRGIFDSPVYTSKVHGTGSFNVNEIEVGTAGGEIYWDKARISVGIPDTRGIDSGTEMVWNGTNVSFESGVPATAIGTSGISAPVTLNRSKKNNTFEFDLTLRGSQKFDLIPLGKTTNVTMASNWPTPSFTGEFLPQDRELKEDGFTAHWTVSSLGRSIPQTWTGSGSDVPIAVQENINKSIFGVDLYQDVDFYTLVDRAVKYAVLFIALTFLSFFMFEVLSNLRIHPMNYLFVGLAIALFFLLLLSISENIGFPMAYLISTLSITALITGYSRAVLKARKKAGIITFILIALYSYLYVLLQLDELALLFGAVLLFVILSTVMYLTRHINWYEASSDRKSMSI
jgi:inner membrane protein